MMSLLRITFGVLVGVAFFASLAFFGQRFPAAAPRVVGIFLGLLGMLLPYSVVYVSLRRGWIRIRAIGKVSVYERHKNPFGFWSYICFWLFIGTFFFAFGICFVVSPDLLK
jgi:xanthosine utilization system XapX-like protein